MIISNLVPILFMYGTIRLNNNYFNKQFWEINLKGSQVNLTYGKIGIKNPATIEKKFLGENASADAKKFAEKKINEKIRKGYLEI